MEYEKIGWQNREVKRPRTYTMVENADGTVTLTPAPGEIVNPGTPLNQDNLNHMEQGIADCADAVNATDKYARAVRISADQHINSKNNPHAVTKVQIGLDQVPNVATNDQTVTYSAATEDEQLSSGETMQTAFSKLARAVKRLYDHRADRANPHAVTKDQVGLGDVVNASPENMAVNYVPNLQMANLKNGEKMGAAFSKLYAAVANLMEHLSDKSNPHAVTKEQVGLGNVPNLNTNSQTPTYTEAAEDAELVSGETMATAFGKLARAVNRLYAHIAEVDNPHKVDVFQACQQLFGETELPPAAEGSFVGDGNSTITVNGYSRSGKFIDLGFTPSRVMILICGAEIVPGHTEGRNYDLLQMATQRNMRGILFGTGKNYYHSGCSDYYISEPAEILLNRGHGGAAVCTNGFVVQYDSGMYVNEKGVTHIYRAWR